MFCKKIRNKLKLSLGLLLCSIAVLSAPASTIVTYAAETEAVEPCTDIREWRWKIEDGKLYKRLYNRSTGLWESDWIYVCDYPEGI